MTSANQAADWAHEVGASPVTQSSKFYALYYLSNVEEQQSAEPEFRFFTQQLEEQLFWYGVAIVAFELANTGLFRPDLPGGMEWDTEASVDKNQGLLFLIEDGIDIEPVVQESKRKRDMSDDAADIMRNMNSYNNGIHGDYWLQDKRDIKKVLKNAEGQYSLSEPYRFLNAAEEVFNLPFWGRWESIPQGGELWANVSNLFQKRPEYSKIMFIDLVFGAEHNNGQLFDKVERTEKEMEIVNSMYPEYVQSESEFDRQLDAVTAILDAARNGPIETVIDVAARTGECKPAVEYKRRMMD